MRRSRLARAGDAGRGAVVANEVRALAQRSGQALKDVEGLITKSNAKVQEVGLVTQAGASLKNIVESVKEVAELMSELAASQEQSSGLDQVSKAVTSMDELTQRNAALVEEDQCGPAFGAVGRDAVASRGLLQDGSERPGCGAAGSSGEAPRRPRRTRCGGSRGC